MWQNQSKHPQSSMSRATLKLVQKIHSRTSTRSKMYAVNISMFLNNPDTISLLRSRVKLLQYIHYDMPRHPHNFHTTCHMCNHTVKQMLLNSQCPSNTVQNVSAITFLTIQFLLLPIWQKRQIYLFHYVPYTYHHQMIVKLY